MRGGLGIFIITMIDHLNPSNLEKYFGTVQTYKQSSEENSTCMLTSDFLEVHKVPHHPEIDEDKVRNDVANNHQIIDDA